MLIDLTALPYIQAAGNTFRVANARTVQQIVIHTSDAPKEHGSARSVANYFHNGSEGRSASAHYSVDAEEIIHCVQNKDVAFGAPGANTNGLHIEHAGTADESADDWQDDYNKAMLELSAQLTATLCNHFDIPAVWLTSAQVAAHERGITGHHEVTHAYPNLHGSHEDPGPDFPKEDYIALVQAELEQSARATQPSLRRLVVQKPASTKQRSS